MAGNAQADGNVITVNGSLTLTDSSENKAGTITGGNNTGNTGGVLVNDRATFTMTGGTISGNAASENGGGVYVDGGEFTMEGGTIGGTTANTAQYGGGVYVNGGTFTMEEDANSGSTCMISGNTASVDGGGVYVNGGEFSLSDGTITGNVATASGGGVRVYSGKFTMEGGTITNNAATASGGGVHVFSEGTFTMTGGTITGNAANTAGGGVYVNGSSTFNISGAPEVTGNKIGQDAANNVYLYTGREINVTGKLTAGASIGVTAKAKPETAGLVTLTSGLKGNGDLSAFTSDDEYTIGWNDAGSEAVLGLIVAATATGYTGDYDGAAHGISVNVTAPASGATVKYGEHPDACDKDVLEYTDVGEYTVYYQVTAQGYFPVAGSAVVKIDPAAATVTVTGKTNTAPYDGKAHTVNGYDVKSSTPLYKEADFTFSGKATATQTEAGRANMGLAANQFSNVNPNFSKVTFEVTDGWQEITPIEATVTITGKTNSAPYNGKAHTVSGYDVKTSTPLYKEGDFTFSGKASATQTNAGKAVMGLTASQFTNTNPNFSNVTFNVTDGWQEVTPAAATIEAKAQTITEGESIRTGVDQVKVSGLARGHKLKAIKLTVSSSANSAKASTTKTIAVSGAKIVDASGVDVTGNYRIAYQSGKLTILPKPKPKPKPDYTLLASMATCGQKALKVSWTSVKGADGYEVFLTKSDCSFGKGMIMAVFKGNTAKFTGLKKRMAYKACVRAWKLVNGKKTYIGKASPTVYAITGGWNSEYCNAKSVKTDRTGLTLKVGKSKTLKATVVGVKGSRKVLQKEKPVRWYSSDRNVATVDGNGKIVAVGKGSCTIIAIANNGVSAKVKVKVK